jgi:serine/threonine protein kinase
LIQKVSEPVFLSNGVDLLNRYRLVRRVSQDAVSETWIANDHELANYILRIWPFTTESPDDTARALWNTELRILYRLCSSRKAEQAILMLKDGGIDREKRCFVMVLESKGLGYEPLSSIITQRQKFSWLSAAKMRIPSMRAPIWEALKRLAEGITSLHTQHVIHRNIAAETVYVNADLGPESWRLGGFEWSFRLGIGNSPQVGKSFQWALPPEVNEGHVTYSFDTDWYAFGLLICRIFASIEALKELSPQDIHRRVTQELRQNASLPISALEREFIMQLLGTSERDRLIYGKEIIVSIERIQRALASGLVEDNIQQPLILLFDKGNMELISAAANAGYLPEISNPTAPYSPINDGHIVALKEFLRKDLQGARICGIEGAERWTLVGTSLTLRIAPYRDLATEKMEESWEIAFLSGPAELRGATHGFARDIGQVQILALPRREALDHRNHQTWSRFLPKSSLSKGYAGEVGKLHEFLRCTNQLELLMSVSKIFPYRVVTRKESPDGWQRLEVVESAPSRLFPQFCQINGGLVRYLHDEVASGKPHSNEVLLTHNDQLHVSGVRSDQWWEVEKVGQPGEPIRLRRRFETSGEKSADTGYLRTYGLNGQVRLIERRKKAIDHIEQHAFLLSALATPGMQVMDTGSPTVGFSLPVDKLDELKRAVIEDIERVRPIYALQGPPGTGKTTLVAYLLRRIFADDPVAQVLVTAQAHPAVDVLRKKVREESFSDMPEAMRPIGIRLGSRKEVSGEADEESTESVTKKLLTETINKLEATAHRSDIQDRWRNLIKDNFTTAGEGNVNRFVRDIQQLVKRSAGITYCTTSARDLEDLAEGSENFDWSFDWSIVEEAGRVHGFDLALPLAAGHRWLLVGDQDQLDPFHLDAFVQGIEDLDNAVSTLDDLDERRFLDDDWIKLWQVRSDTEKDEFKHSAQTWMRTFGRLFSSLENVTGSRKVTENVSCGASAGLLKHQWRMHPTIGSLISEAFYKNVLENKTVAADGSPIHYVVHDYNLDHLANSIKGKAIIWIDIPWCQRNPAFYEVGEQQGKLNYSNEGEVRAIEGFLHHLQRLDGTGDAHTLAILSPYTQQTAKLENRLRNVAPPAGFRLADALSASPVGLGKKWAHTVDSFQGNQADLVIVSLVRNSAKLPIQGLGFLREHRRINVQFSRAERLLVLVGSWDFFWNQVKNVSLESPLEEVWFWKRILSTLERDFQAGTALKLDGQRFYLP